MQYLKTKAAAEYLGYSVHSLQQWRCKGGGPEFLKAREGGNIRYTKDDLDAWMRRMGKFQNTSQTSVIKPVVKTKTYRERLDE